MSSTRTTCLLLAALFVLSFGLTSALEPRFQSLENRHKQSTDFFAVVLGDTRFALGGYFYRKADAYYHSGYYPTIFDNNQNFETAHMAEDTGAITSKNSGEEDSFMGPPRDWLDAFGRHFIPNRHTHLDEGGPTDDLSTSSDIDEILPWLKLSTELNPDDVQTYVVTAYWLRQRMNKVSAAEKVLLQGLRYNPDSYEILFELGRLYNESYHDSRRPQIPEPDAGGTAERQAHVGTDHHASRRARTERRQPAKGRGLVSEGEGRLENAWRHPAAD
jgi:tetratricopeptide (TPR) repeat protein